MAEKIVLLYETEYGKTQCDVASRVLAQVAVAFGHALTVPVARCEAADEVSDAVLELCAGAGAVLAGESGMRCLPALADELLCVSRLRELRYAHLTPCRSLMGAEQPLNMLLLQSLTNDGEGLQATARLAFDLSRQENLPVCQVPPSGKLRESWQRALDGADTLSALYHARELPLPAAVPEMVRRPARLGVMLCPPYAGSVLADAAAALAGAEGMCFDTYLGGQCPVYAPMRAEGEAVNPFGMLRALHRLLRDGLRLEQEAACLEAGIRNVLQAGWRTADIAQEGLPVIDAAGIGELICQQVEVAGAWINDQ